MRVSYRTVTGALVTVVVCIGFSKVNDRCSGVGWVALGWVGDEKAVFKASNIIHQGTGMKYFDVIFVSSAFLN